MPWIFLAFLEPVLHGGANIIDNYLSNKVMKKVWTLVFYGCLFNLLLTPLVFLVGIPEFPAFSMLPFYLLVAAIEVLYLFPYFKALQNDETSIVISLFSLGSFFVPILAFFLVNEVLATNQYLGFILIILASTALTLHGKKGKFRFNKSFFYMLFCSMMLSLEVVVYKYIFENVSWVTGFFWTNVLAFVLALSLLLIKSARKDIFRELKDVENFGKLFAFDDLLTFAGTAVGTFVISLIPVSVETAISEFQPAVVLIYALLLQKLSPRIFKEKTDRKSLFKKFFLFATMVAGVVLVVQ